MKAVNLKDKEKPKDSIKKTKSQINLDSIRRQMKPQPKK